MVMDALLPSAVRIDLQSSDFEAQVASASLQTEEEPWFKFPFTCQVQPCTATAGLECMLHMMGANDVDTHLRSDMFCKASSCILV